MLNLHLDVLEFTARADRWQTIDELVNDFAALADHYGFPIFILTGLPRRGDQDIEPLVIANHWPGGWADRYREQTYFPDDPVSKWSLTVRRPFRWREAQKFSPATRRTHQIAGEAYEFGLADGYAFPLRGRRGGAVVSLASEATLRDDPRVQASLFLAAAYFRYAAERLMLNSTGSPRLTGREREVLQWCAAGKTEWEIGQILTIAENTVKTHLRSVREKLEVATTTQAVAVALSSGEMQL